MAIEWKTVVAVIIAMLLIGAAWMFFTKRHIDGATGAIVTKFSGFGG